MFALLEVFGPRKALPLGSCRCSGPGSSGVSAKAGASGTTLSSFGWRFGASSAILRRVGNGSTLVGDGVSSLSFFSGWSGVCSGSIEWSSPSMSGVSGSLFGTSECLMISRRLKLATVVVLSVGLSSLELSDACLVGNLSYGLGENFSRKALDLIPLPPTVGVTWVVAGRVGFGQVCHRSFSCSLWRCVYRLIFLRSML